VARVAGVTSCATDRVAVRPSSGIQVSCRTHNQSAICDKVKLNSALWQSRSAKLIQGVISIAELKKANPPKGGDAKLPVYG